MNQLNTEVKPETLPTMLSKHGFKYTLIKRTNNAAIYVQQKQWEKNKPLSIISYEVFKIRIQKDLIAPNGHIIPTKEKFPSNEDFGRYAWSVPTLIAAETIFNELEAKMAPEVLVPTTSAVTSIRPTKKRTVVTGTQIVTYNNYVIRRFANGQLMAHINGKPKGPKTPLIETLWGKYGYNKTTLISKSMKQLADMLFAEEVVK